MPAETLTAAEVIDATWRADWARLVAILVRRTRRLDLVEDALGEAFAAAARQWERDGVPANPPAWLVTVARRRIQDRMRAEAIANRTHHLLIVEATTPAADHGDADTHRAADTAVGDDQLRLMLMCCHPALAPSSQVALAMRLVVGVPTDDIAALFLVPPATMSARLTRAKAKIVRAGIPFAIAAADQLDRRVSSIVRIAYLAFTAGYAPRQGTTVVRADLAGEAIRLARMLDAAVPGRDDVNAALALMLFQHSRRDARERDGELVLLADQDRTRWDHDAIAEGRARLATVAEGRPGAEELRLQARIAHCHAVAASAATTDWVTIAGLYEQLVGATGSPVAVLNQAVAVAEAAGAEQGLDVLDTFDDLDRALGFGHRLPAVRGELLARLGRRDEARAELTSAVERCSHDAERRHLQSRLDELT